MEVNHEVMTGGGTYGGDDPLDDALNGVVDDLLVGDALPVSKIGFLNQNPSNVSKQTHVEKNVKKDAALPFDPELLVDQENCSTLKYENDDSKQNATYGTLGHRSQPLMPDLGALDKVSRAQKKNPYVQQHYGEVNSLSSFNVHWNKPFQSSENESRSWTRCSWVAIIANVGIWTAVGFTAYSLSSDHSASGVNVCSLLQQLLCPDLE